MESRSRVTRGIPSGGQFATESRSASSVALGDPAPDPVARSLSSGEPLDLPSMDPSSVDAELVPYLMETAKARGELDNTYNLLDRYRAQLAELDPTSYNAVYTIGPTVARHEERLPALEAAATEAREAEQPFHDEFTRRGGWTRAFLVRNANGHVHSSMQCATCFPTTDFAWITDLSGHDESEIVEAAGEQACTECYPSAPVDVLRRKSTIEDPQRKAARLERETKAAERAAAKAAKAISNPDGTPLRHNSSIDRKGGTWLGSRIETETAAQQELVGMITNHRAWNYSIDEPFAARLKDALAHKRGITVDELMTDLEPKILAKIKRDSR